MPRFFYFWLTLALPLMVGCDGCRREPDPDQEAPQLEAFAAGPPMVFPGDQRPLGGGIKPGHWFTAAQPLKSNLADLRGLLRSDVMFDADVANVSPQASAPPRRGLSHLRPAVLPQGQLRRLDYRLLAPLPPTVEEGRCFLSSRLVSPSGGLRFDTGRQPFPLLAAKEFFFVILTSRPERFASLQVASWVRPPAADLIFGQHRANYRIVIPAVEGVLPLSDTMLDWTGTAVLFWDDLSAQSLTPDQQRAVADWIRFGGQLIVNGTSASTAIAGNFLAELLPLSPTGNLNLDPSAAHELLRGHAVAGDRSTDQQAALVTDQSAQLALDGMVAPGAVAIANTGDLVLERQIGRGRVVQSRFDLTSDWLVNWSSFDSFFNSAILRRPRRQFSRPDSSSAAPQIQQTYPDHESIEHDPAVNTRLRITARNGSLSTQDAAIAAGQPWPGSSPVSRFDSLTQIDSRSGIGGWTDSSDVVSICREILRQESGIDIPSAALVVRSLGLYLLILIPVNYLVFRMIGRLEYAWLAVPVIALGGAVLVARAARLDIGFARSQTQIALLELQPDYPRGHLSRVVAIYNSLSSTYQIAFDTIDSVATTIGGAAEIGGEMTFRNGFGDGPILADVAVASNQVQLLHCEEISDVGGTLELRDRDRLINRTGHDLWDLILIEKSTAGEVSVRKADSCAAGGSVRLDAEPSGQAVSAGLPMQTERLIGRLSDPNLVPAGSCRLVGRIDGALPGMAITPAATQVMAQTVVLAHLRHAEVEEVAVDENLVSEFREWSADEPTAPAGQRDVIEATP